MKLHEMFPTKGDITVGDYTLQQEEDREDDNYKIFHNVYKGGKFLEGLDHSPYEYMNQDVFTRYLRFYEQNGRFPNRRDTGKNGPLRNEDIVSMVP